MKNPTIPTLIEDAAGTGYYFYYKDSSIFCIESYLNEKTKETLLINQISDNFVVTADMNNSIYLVCHSRLKGILILQYSDGSWKVIDISAAKLAPNVCLLDVCVLNGSIHIIYATALPLVNFYNIHHLHNDHDTWLKDNISEIYAEDLFDAYSLTTSGDEEMHLVCMRFDGKEYYINYSSYNCHEKKWMHRNIVNLSDKNIRFQLLEYSDRQSLIVSTNEDNTSILFCFEKISDADSVFEFTSLSRIDNIPEDTLIAFNNYGANMVFEYFLEGCYYKYHYDSSQKDWCLKKQVNIGVSEELQTVYYIHLGTSSLNKQQFLSIYSEETEIFEPFELADQKTFTGEQSLRTEAILEGAAQVTNMDEFIPYLIEQIKTLSENVKIINQKLNESGGQANKGTRVLETNTSKAAVDLSNIKNNNFRDKFMNSSSGFSGFKQSPPVRPRNSNLGLPVTGRVYNPNTGFRDNFNKNYGNSSLTNNNTFLYSGNGKYSAGSESGGLPVSELKNNNAFFAENSDAADITEEPESDLEAGIEGENKKSGSIFKLIADFFK